MAIDLEKLNREQATKSEAKGESEPKIAMSIYSKKDKPIFEAWMQYRAKTPLMSDVARIKALLDYAGLMPAPATEAKPAADAGKKAGK